MFKAGPIAAATLQTSLVLGLRLVIQAGTILLVARLLGAEQFGIFAGITALAVILGTFSTFGTHLLFLAEISKQPSQRTNILSYAVPTTLLNGSILLIIYLAIAHVLFSQNQDFSLLIICIGFAEIILLPLFLFPVTEKLAHEKTAFSQLITIYPLLLRFLSTLAIILFVQDYILNTFAYAYLGVAIFSLLTVKLIKKDAWLNHKAWCIPTQEQLKESSGYATLALTAAGPTELDKILAATLLPLGVGGIYVAASRVIGAATLPVIALLLSAMPRLFRESDQKQVKNSRLSKWIFLSVFIYGISLTLCLFFITPLFEWLFGKDYKGLAEMLKWVSLAIPGLALRITAGSILMTLNHPWWRAGFEFSGILCMISTSLLFIQNFGDIGMALAVACSEWLMAIIGMLMIIGLSRKTV